MKRGTIPHFLQALLESHEQLLKSKIPIETQSHFRQANKELLMGIRTWVDHHIGGMEQRAEKESPMSNANHQEVKKIIISE